MEVGGALNAASALPPEKIRAPVERGAWGDPISGLNILESRKISYPVGILTPAGRLIAGLTELLMAVCVRTAVF
jgi:hypothetical protein